MVVVGEERVCREACSEEEEDVESSRSSVLGPPLGCSAWSRASHVVESGMGSHWRRILRRSEEVAAITMIDSC